MTQEDVAVLSLQGANLSPLVWRAFDALNDAGVTWCLLRDATGSQDVDVLVRESHAEAAKAALDHLGFVMLPAWGRGSHRFFLAYDQQSDTWARLDLVTRLEFGPYQELSLPAASQVLERRNFDGKVAAPDQDDELWLLLLHCTIDKGSFRGARAARVQELARHGTAAGPLRDFVEELCPQGWGTERLLAAAAAGRWVELEQAGSVIRASWERRGPLKAATGSLTARSLRLATRALLVPRRGITVALLAPDGAGKSTLAEGLRSTFFFPVRIVYMGTFDQRAGRSGLLTLGPHLMRQWLRYGRARAHKARGRLVIFDRYTFDKLLPPPRPPDLPRRIRRWALAHSCPLPDLVVVLDVPSEEMFRRKGEHDVSHLEKRRRGYLELSKRVARMHVVDATREPDIVRRDVTALIWRVLAKRLTHRRRLSDQAAS